MIRVDSPYGPPVYRDKGDLFLDCDRGKGIPGIPMTRRGRISTFIPTSHRTRRPLIGTERKWGSDSVVVWWVGPPTVRGRSTFVDNVVRSIPVRLQVGEVDGETDGKVRPRLHHGTEDSLFMEPVSFVSTEGLWIQLHYGT